MPSCELVFPQREFRDVLDKGESRRVYPVPKASVCVVESNLHKELTGEEGQKLGVECCVIGRVVPC